MGEDINLEARRVFTKWSLTNHYPLEPARKMGVDSTCPGCCSKKSNTETVRNCHVAIEAHEKV